MSGNLVIVESPAKAKTIEKFLGKDFQVVSCFGHIADLPSKGLKMQKNGDFSLVYLILDDKKAVVKNLKSLSKKVKTVWLASDEDREGEAIAWHLKEQLDLKDETTKRIVFHEITKSAILKAVENPRKINYDLVDAQQARRVLDRIVGFEISPVLWTKIKPGLSAGRVQSVAVRLIVEKERKILGFEIKSSYKVMASFCNQDGKEFRAEIVKNFENEEKAALFLKDCIAASFKIFELNIKSTKKYPVPPFTTSSLQQEASRKLGFSVSKTMIVAQQLYESGRITYMRTDSVNLSQESKKAIANEIQILYGNEFSKSRNYITKFKTAQEAHEAIRPTDISVYEVNDDRDKNRLYDLIWKRTLASQMSDAEVERTQVKIQNDKNDKIFVANGEMIKFEGFLKIYLESEDDEDQKGMLPKLTLHETLSHKYISATERFSSLPYRFTEASLVKQLEDLGIGRPSTYAPTISTISKRGYVEKGTFEGEKRDYRQMILKEGQITSKILTETVGSNKGKLIPTPIGSIVNDFLVKNFDKVLDYSFTANMEDDFDQIARGNKDWKMMIKEFYKDFHPIVESVSENTDRERGERILGKHPESGKTVLVRLGKFGSLAQIGDSDDKEKRFVSLLKDQNLETVTLEEVLDLFSFPKKLGLYEGKEVIISNGRFGPYVEFDSMYVSLSKEKDMSIDLDAVINLIEQKRAMDAPIAEYEKFPVQKGVGRFGPFIKWNNIYINVGKNYNFDNLSFDDIKELIENKKKKEKEKLVHNWEKEGIRVEKSRWGRHKIIKGTTKIELNKIVNVSNFTLEDVQKIIMNNTSKNVKKGYSKK